MKISTKQTALQNKQTVAIVANEFFDPSVGGMGGFGWVAREAALCLATREAPKQTSLDSGAFFLAGNFPPAPDIIETRVHGLPLVFARPNDWPGYTTDVRRRNVDLILSIDYRPSYDFPLSVLSETPMILWVQDPRPSDDIDKINTLRVPGSAVAPQGIEPIDCTSLAQLVERSTHAGRQVIFASPAPGLLEKANRTYAVDTPKLEFLPYLLDFDPGEIRKSSSPRVVFLGRLDPIKRPWIFVELAQRFPRVEFLLLGKPHFHGAGSWQPGSIPDNVRMLGHVEGEEKRSLLASAWALVNTSIHEALPVSFLEAMLFEIPIVSCQNPENLVSRFGHYTGRFDGTGLDSLPHFTNGLTRLLDDSQLRVRLGKAARAWAIDNHGRDNFLLQFHGLCNLITRPERRHEHAADRADKELCAVAEPLGFAKSYVDSQETIRAISAAVPSGQPFILVDNNELRSLFHPSMRSIPFIERNGEYWGPPDDDATAIRELERLRDSGVRYIVFAWPAFWWLEHYSQFHTWLRSQQACVLENERFILFTLENKNDQLRSSKYGEETLHFVSRE